MSSIQLKNWVKRDWVQLSGERNPGRGKRRLYTAEDMLTLCVAKAMYRLVPINVATVLAKHVRGRADRLMLDSEMPRKGYSLIITPKGDDDWLFTGMFDDDGGQILEEEKLPPMFAVLDVDKLLLRTSSLIQAVMEEKPLPEYPEMTADEEKDFFRRWDKDQEGRKVMTGLSHAETQEYERHENARFNDQDHGQSDRFLELCDKHELARQVRLSREQSE